jgi:hypothetical protein
MGKDNTIQASVEDRIRGLLQDGQPRWRWQLLGEALYYRTSTQGIVLFSVQERQLLKPSNGGDANYDAAAQLLQRVINEWEVVRKETLEKQEIADAKASKLKARRNARTQAAVKPPVTYVQSSGVPAIRPYAAVASGLTVHRPEMLARIASETLAGHRDLAIQSALAPIIAALGSSSKVTISQDAVHGVLPSITALRDTLASATALGNSAQLAAWAIGESPISHLSRPIDNSGEVTIVKNHPYVELDSKIKSLLASSPGDLWKRLVIEKELKELEENSDLRLRLQASKQSVYRALTVLEDNGELLVSGKGKQQQIQLKPPA